MCLFPVPWQLNNFLNHFSVTRHCRDYHPTNVTKHWRVLKYTSWHNKRGFLPTIINLRAYVAAPRGVTSMSDSHGLTKYIVTDPKQIQNAFPADPFGRVSFISDMWQSVPPGANPLRLVPNTNANSGRNSWNTPSIVPPLYVSD